MEFYFKRIFGQEHSNREQMRKLILEMANKARKSTKLHNEDQNN